MGSVGVNIMERLELESKRIVKPEHILAKGLSQPFNSMNSAPRKIVYSSEQDQIISIMGSEPPFVQTGYEDEVGRHCSSYIVSDDDYQILAKISKYQDLPDHHYILVMKSNTKNHYKIVERTVGEHITETYGYLKDNSYLDSLSPTSPIKTGDLISKSTNYSEYNNRQDGVNLNTAYLAIPDSTEDSMIISKSAAKKMSSPLFKNVITIINDNDIPLNLYGDNEVYKSFPNVGENVEGGILCAIRREVKDESLFALAWDRLREVMISDEKYTPKDGRVIDINIHCNNPKALEDSAYNIQLKQIYDNQMRYSREIVDTLEFIVNDRSSTHSPELEHLYLNHKKAVDGKLWLNKHNRPFSNIQLEFMILDIIPLDVGDKVTDRYGGKGVISKVKEDHEMPIMDNGEPLEFIINPRGPVSRENPGQLIELSLNFIARHIIDKGYVLHNCDDFISIYLEFLELVSPLQYRDFKAILDKCDEDQKHQFIESLEGGIVTSIEPISEVIDLIKLSEIYQKFSWLSPTKMKVPMVGSDGTVRHVESKRYVTCAKKYLYRLKQYSEDKSSMTSLSSTNLKNEPSKSKSSSEFRTPYPKTPVRFGVMETGNMMHFLDIYPVVNNLMIHSTSPQARRQAEELLTGNPFDIDIKIKQEATNRNVEILNAYLKTIGLKLVFEKKDEQLPSAMLYMPFENSHIPPGGFTSAMLSIPFENSHIPPGGFTSAMETFTELPHAMTGIVGELVPAEKDIKDTHSEVPFPSAMVYIDK